MSDEPRGLGQVRAITYEVGDYLDMLEGWFPDVLAEAELTVLCLFGEVSAPEAEVCEGCGIAVALTFWWDIETREHGRRWKEVAEPIEHTPRRCRS